MPNEDGQLTHYLQTLGLARFRADMQQPISKRACRNSFAARRLVIFVKLLDYVTSEGFAMLNFQCMGPRVGA